VTRSGRIGSGRDLRRSAATAVCSAHAVEFGDATTTQAPGGITDAPRGSGSFIEFDPPRKLAITWQGSGNVSFELEPKGNKVLLTVIHRRLPDRATLLKVGAGWHTHLDVLVARATGEQPAPFWDGWSRLQKEYDRRMPA